MQVTEDCFFRRLDAPDERSTARAWGVAQALYQRRLMPEPLAMLRSHDAAVLALARSEDLVALAEAPAAERRAALIVAIDRLLGIGLDASSLRADAFVFSRARHKALVLDPTACVPGRVHGANRRAIAREVAAQLLR